MDLLYSYFINVIPTGEQFLEKVIRISINFSGYEKFADQRREQMLTFITEMLCFNITYWVLLAKKV